MTVFDFKDGIIRSTRSDKIAWRMIRLAAVFSEPIHPAFWYAQPRMVRVLAVSEAAAETRTKRLMTCCAPIVEITIILPKERRKSFYIIIIYYLLLFLYYFLLLLLILSIGVYYHNLQCCILIKKKKKLLCNNGNDSISSAVPSPMI